MTFIGNSTKGSGGKLNQWNTLTVFGILDTEYLELVFSCEIVVIKLIIEVSAWTSLVGVRSERSDVIKSLVFGPSTSRTDQAGNTWL